MCMRTLKQEFCTTQASSRFHRVQHLGALFHCDSAHGANECAVHCAGVFRVSKVKRSIKLPPKKTAVEPELTPVERLVEVWPLLRHSVDQMSWSVSYTSTTAERVVVLQRSGSGAGMTEYNQFCEGVVPVGDIGGLPSGRWYAPNPENVGAVVYSRQAPARLR